MGRERWHAQANLHIHSCPLRLQKRADLKKRLDLDRYMTPSEEEVDDEIPEQKRPGDVRAFSSNGMRATVTVKPFSIHTDR